MLKKSLSILLIILIVLVLFTIPKINKQNILRTSLEISDITNLETTRIYLLNNNDLLVGVDVFLDSDSLEEKVNNIINYLTTTNNNFNTLKPYIPTNTKVLSTSLNNNTLILDLSKEILNTNTNLDIIKTGLVYSLLSIPNVENISISIEGQYLKGFTKELNKDIGINKEYLFTKSKDTSKVVIYYLDDTSTYYVPITKYLNDKREKIEIIIDELKNNYYRDLVSVVSYQTKLIDYQEIENVLFLNFNSDLLNDNPNIEEKIFNCISYSVFDNYDVNMVMFEVNNKKIKQVKRKEIQ